MAEFDVDGRMTVLTLKNKFKETYGVTLRVYQGNNAGRGAKKADDKQRLGEVADERESLSAIEPLNITPEMTVGEFETEFQKKFDISIQIANATDDKLLDNKVKLIEAKNH